jgi:hypothetical protein
MLLKRSPVLRSGVVAAGAAFVSAAFVLGITAIPRGDAIAGDNDNVICVGPDSILRVPPRGGADCPAGTRRLELAGPSNEAKNLGCAGCDPWEDTAAADDAKANPKLAELEHRLENLEQSSLLVVVDKQGRKVLSVGPGVMTMYNREGFAVDSVRVTADGGDFMSRSSDNHLWVTVGARGTVGGLRVYEGGVLRLDLGRQPAGNDTLRFIGPNGTTAGMGESRAGSGVALVSDSQGRVRARMSIEDDKGRVNVFGPDGTGILSMTEGEKGSGLFTVQDRTGTIMVKMGVNHGTYGAVLTGPRAGFPYVPRSGLPGSYFFGCVPGPACQP